jgi:hypothetical protein
LHGGGIKPASLLKRPLEDAPVDVESAFMMLSEMWLWEWHDRSV